MSEISKLEQKLIIKKIDKETLKVQILDNNILSLIAGQFNENLKTLEKLTNATLFFRGNSITCKGSAENITIFSEAIKLVDSLSLDESRYGYIVGNLGSCYYQKGDFDAAYKYLQIDADKSKERDADRKSYLNAELMLAKIDLKRKDHKLALHRLNVMMEVHESLLWPLQKLTVLELYMQAFKLSGNKSKYEFYLKQWIALIKI